MVVADNGDVLAVLSCTTALFLSGVAIQQRTVRHLRAAIRPETLSPQVYLPDRFREDTTELADGTIVMLDEYDRPVRLKSGRISLGKAPAAAAADADITSSGEGQGEEEAVVIEVQETLPEVLEDAGHEQQKVMTEAEELPEIMEEPSERHDMPEEGELGQTPSPPPSPPAPQTEESAKVQAQPQAAPWEVRNEDMPRERPAATPEEEEQKPISRAERRRLIKEEIQRLSQGDEPIYYQRRLW